MEFAGPGLLLVLVGYLVVVAVLAVVAYLVVRFGVRDGMRAHTRWLERRQGPPAA